jgi:SAM-dependent methyltransferase
MNMLMRAAKTVVRNSRFLRLAAHVVRPYDAIYHRNYYAETVEAPALQSARVMASSMIDAFKPQSIIDVGCGTGALLEAFRQMGCNVFGLEYSEAALAYCRKRALPVRKFNIAKDNLQASFDLAVSFEVGEHLAPWSADRYVELLCSLSSRIVLSAAPPGYGGTDHINEQPQSYWINKFTEKGCAFDQDTTKRLSLNWRENSVAFWYSDNVMVFQR